MKVLRIATSGNVDDGKSTLIGRLLWDTKSLFTDQIENLKEATERRGESGINLAYVTDGLRAEREQGITIDVAYRYFNTSKAKFIIADCPGHLQYTRNFVTGLSNSEVALILVDASKGITEQTSRHLLYSILMGTPHIILCINKMDMVDFDEVRFNEISTQIQSQFKFNKSIAHFIPISALTGDNVTETSNKMPWYKGESLLELLEDVPQQTRFLNGSFRLPIQTVMQVGDLRVIAGRLAFGKIKVGDAVESQPSGMKSKVKSIFGPGGTPVLGAECGESISVELETDIDVSRGFVLSNSTSKPEVSRSVSATLITFRDVSQAENSTFDFRQPQKTCQGMIAKIHDHFDFSSKQFVGGVQHLTANTAYHVTIDVSEEIVFDTYDFNRETGCFLFTQPSTGEVVAAGLIQAAV